MNMQELIELATSVGARVEHYVSRDAIIIQFINGQTIDVRNLPDDVFSAAQMINSAKKIQT